MDFPLYAWSLRTHDRRLRHFGIFFNDGIVKVDQVTKVVETELNGPGKLWDTAQCTKKYFDEATLTRCTERKIMMRTFTDDNLHKFNENLSNAKWSSFRNMEDPNEAYNDFTEEYSRTYNTCFPLKVLKSKQFFSP